MNFCFGQNENDIVKYMNVAPTGSARYSSMAGSFGALGGDVTTFILNPAGTGIYIKKELSLTPGYLFSNTKSMAEGSIGEDNTSKFVFNNVGYVNSNANERNRNFYINYGFAYNKTADFNRKSSVSFFNPGSSMLFSFVNRANGIAVEDLAANDPFSSYMAYEAYLIDEDPDSANMYLTQPRYENSFDGVDQKSTTEETGSMGEISGNLSIAVMEKFYFGMTISATTGNYTLNSNFTETTTVDSLLLNSYNFNYTQETDLDGLQVILGMILKPEKWLRVGIAYHIPYRLNVTDNFSTYVRSQWKDGDAFSVDSPDGGIQYRLRNPGKWMLSAAVISGFKGLLSLDLEWMNYAAASIESDDFDFSQENLAIAENLKSAMNIRLGAELWRGRYNFRLGYAFRQNPYVRIQTDGKKFYNTFSGGVGLLTEVGFFTNLSLAYKQNGQSYYPYGQDIAPVITDSFNNYEVLVSIGIKFN
jgi:hypothetical protein